jgi:hypothetical protein
MDLLCNRPPIISIQKSNQEVVGICVGVSAIQNIPIGALVRYVQGLRDNYVKTFDYLVTQTLKLGSRCFANGLSLNGISDVRNFVLRVI